jgi:hypothetical protein
MGSLKRVYPLPRAAHEVLYADVRPSQALPRTEIQAIGVVHAVHVVLLPALCSPVWSSNLVHRIFWRIHGLLRVKSGIRIY